MSSAARLVLKGIRSPQKIRPYLEQRYRDIRYRPSILNRPAQKKLIHEFIEKGDFMIIILDSCRYDYFREEVGEFLEGELKTVYTSATATMGYIQTIWDGNYEDMTYITGLSAPTDHAFKRKGRGYRPSEHIGEFIHVWNDCNQKELGAVLPEVMTQRALEHHENRSVVHYVQPHAPYIGDYRLRKEDAKTEWGESLQDIYEKIGRYDPDKKVISDEQLRKAYRSNLRRCLNAVRELVTRVDVPVVVTADHGEMLGEGGRYIHGGRPSQQLCKLPWFVVDDLMIGKRGSTEFEPSERNDTDFTKGDVEEQLKHLGYI